MINTNYTIKRVGDSSFLLDITNIKTPFRLKIDSKNLNPEEMFRIAKLSAAKIHLLIQDRLDPINSKGIEGLVFKNKNWKISKYEPNSKIQKLSSKLFSFFHLNESDNVNFIKLSEGKNISSSRLPKQTRENFSVRQTLDGSTEISPEISSDCILSADQYNSGIRDIINLENYPLDLTRDAFRDPYTYLATEAFQVYEKEFVPKDDFTPDKCEFIIVEQDNMLYLVEKSNKLLNYGVNNTKTVERYRNYLISEFGEEKIKYIEFLYRINFEEMIENQLPLTPEHVYRMNIGVQNIEMNDVNHLLSGLCKIDSLIQDIKDDEAMSLKVQNAPLFQALFTGSQMRGISKRLNVSYDQLTVYDLKEWLKTLEFPENAKDLLPDQLSELMKIFALNKEEANRGFTGRKIEEEIISGSYTLADVIEYKPWVDQQELLQVIPKLVNGKSFEAYCENLTHLIVKKQLVREHPTEGYRVGALIPAMKDQNGHLRWYKVSSFISNGRGIVSYTLESACNDPTLPLIKLYRSTASDLHSLQASSTVLHDLNSINSPGYEGRGLADSYESDFFHQTTIPLWVGYTYQSGKVKDPLEVVNLLKSANSALKESHQIKYAKKSIKQIIRSHDALLNELLLGYNTLIGLLLPSTDKGRYFDIYRGLVNRYIRKASDSSKISPVQQKKDAEGLKRELLRFIPVIEDEMRVAQIRSLIKEIDEHLLSDRHRSIQKKAKDDFDEEIYNRLKYLKNAAEVSIRRGDNEAVNVISSTWQNVLNKYARSKGESIEDKLERKVVLTGHSLGGACAQSHFVYFTADQRRIPLPGQTYEAFIFCEPAINEEDNRSFLQFGNQHHKLLNAIKSQFSIQRRQSVGDFVPAGGEEHLGAAMSEQEERESARWLKAENRLRKKLPGAKDPSLAETTTSHGMKFGGGTKKKTFLPDEEEDLGGDYIETWYSNYIQGIFDKGKTMQGVDLNLLEAMWKDVHVKLWEMPRIDAVQIERIRTNLLLLIAKNMINKRGGDHVREEFLDDLGVLAVNEQGVQSMRKGHQNPDLNEEAALRKTLIFQAQAKASHTSVQRSRMDQFLKSAVNFEQPKLLSVVINTEKSAANHLFEFVIHQDCIWTKKIGESVDKWTPIIFDGKNPIALRCDGANLIVLDNENQIHYKKIIEEWRGSEIKKDVEAQKKLGISATELATLHDEDYVVFDKRTRDNWKKDWCSLPIIGLLSKGKLTLSADAIAWDISHRGRFGNYYTDGFHKQPVDTGVTTLYVVGSNKKTITKYDPWSPLFAKVNLEAPEKAEASFEIENLRSAGAMMMMLGYEGTPSDFPGRVNKKLAIKTMLADIDVLGWNPFLKYDYFPHPEDPEIRVVPVEGLYQDSPLPIPKIQEHPLPEGAIVTRIISIVQTGEGNDAKEMRVAGWNNDGQEGYYRKMVCDQNWEFVASTHKLPIDQAISSVLINFPEPFESSVRNYNDVSRARIAGVRNIEAVKLENFGKGSYDAILHLTINGENYDFFIHRKHTFKNFAGIKGSSYDLVIPKTYHQNPLLKEIFPSMVIPLKVKETNDKLRITSEQHAAHFIKKPIIDISFKIF